MIAGQKRPGYICLADRGVIQVDPIMASFLVNTISSLDLEKQKLFREMMNRNVLAFMYVLKTLKR
jgi:succinate dehydrogenase flavin-adding protein (antitoxin of CptAB toxin-antitoxin module)